jgi:hypothetical protein
MGVLRPGAYKDISQDPESARRLASGFWKHEHDFATDIDTWVCDKRKLHEEVQKICMSNNETFKMFHRDAARFLDHRYGDGTGEAYRHSGQDRVAMRFDPFRALNNRDGVDAMAYWIDTTSGTTTTTTTAGTSCGNIVISSPPPQRQQKTKPYVATAKKLVRNMPFVHGGDSLLATLQRDFDHWAGSQLKVVNQ